MIFGDRKAAFNLCKGALEALCEGIAYCTPTLPSHIPLSSLQMLQCDIADAWSIIPVSVGSDAPLSRAGADISAFTFTKAFVFNKSRKLSEEHLDSYQAVILFNLALLYDSKELSTCDRYQATALELYNHSLELSTAGNCALVCSNVMIAAMNNRAQIFFRRHEVESVRALLEELGRSLGNALGNGANVLDDQDINGILLNVYCQTALLCAPGA